MSPSATHASADDHSKQNLSPRICSALIALPFLFPITAGPSVNIWQQLASWMCVAALLLLTGAKQIEPRPSVLVWLAASAALVAVFRSPLLEPTPWLCAAAVVFATCMVAFVGAGLAQQDRARMQAALAHGLIWAGALSAVLGLLQYYDLAGFLHPLTTEPGAGQAFGNLRQRNQFASLISMALIAALWLYASHRSAALPRRLLWAAVVALLLTAAAASTSRTGLLEVLAIVGTAAFIARRERQAQRAGSVFATRLPSPLVVLSWIPLYFAIAWLLPQLAGSGVDSMMQRLSEGAPTGHSRLILWSNVLTLIAERPWTGWGWGELSFAHYMHSGLYPGQRFVEILDNAHNLPLHLAVELGIPAAALICGGFLWLVVRARPWRDRNPFRIMAWALLGVIVLHSLLEYPLWYGPFQLVFGLCLGILWPAEDRNETAACPWARRLPAMAAALLVAVVGYAGWDYIRISQIYLPRDERLPAYEDDTLTKVHGSWLFANQVRFAKLTLTPVTTANAAEVHLLAQRILHFSPEPRVIVKLVESAQLLGLHEEARTEAERFSIAFPLEYGLWLEGKPIDSSAS
ncbi:PglL family O-oligosaccharyltransferase [Variovorax sp. IB41]|uniref:PglL family O-oligosaccharyltransferase n=1 Tax=Variovorax sp. IB41 TaxID=2779370 RepID=UPI0018E77DA9|nr:Wzy polymerase domain-containing protein [Variovorax sp. IB41]MBJ2155881.1 O-antigen ligase C-terminal domain-containing protein [Variovorax sp. IB41]